MGLAILYSETGSCINILKQLNPLLEFVESLRFLNSTREEFLRTELCLFICLFVCLTFALFFSIMEVILFCDKFDL